MDESFQIREFTVSDKDDVVALWAIAFPDEPDWNESSALITQKLTTQPELFFICVRDSQLVGTVIAGYDGVRGWVHKVVSHPSYRGKGVARSLMFHAECALRDLGCVKLNLQVRSGNDTATEFYTEIGYLTEDRISMSKRLA